MMGEMEKKIIRPPGRPPTPGFAPAVASGQFVFVSGQVAQNSSGETVGVGDFRAQCEKAFENIKLILAAQGCNFDDVVRLRVYITDRAHHPIYRQVRDRYLGPTYASTLLYVAGLDKEEWLVEIEVTAIRRRNEERE